MSWWKLIHISGMSSETITKRSGENTALAKSTISQSFRCSCLSCATVKEWKDSLEILCRRVSNAFSRSMQVMQKVKAGRIQAKESKVKKTISNTLTAVYVSECGDHGWRQRLYLCNIHRKRWLQRYWSELQGSPKLNLSLLFPSSHLARARS